MAQTLSIAYKDIRRISDIRVREIDDFFGPPGELRVLDAQVLIHPGEFKTVRTGRSYTAPAGYVISASLRPAFIQKGLAITHFDATNGLIFITNHGAIGLFRELRKSDAIADIVATKLESISFTEVPAEPRTTATGGLCA